MENMFRLLFIVIYVYYGSVQGFQCPLDENLKPKEGTFSDPIYCNVYYHCINGTAYPQQCPPGLLFTVKLKNCRYSLCVDPSQAHCPGEEIVILNNVSNQKSAVQQPSSKDNSHQDFKCDPNIDGTFPNPSDCRQYYHCVSGISWPQQCPSNYYFSPTFNVRDCQVKVCVPLSEAQCPVHGGWSQWSEFGECYPSCGNGLRVRTRECDNPPPSNGGKPCIGDQVEIKQCSQSDCLIPANSEPVFYIANIRIREVQHTHTFERILINQRNLINVTNSHLNVKEAGFYYTSFGITTSKKYSGFMNGLDKRTTIYKSHSRSGMETDAVGSLNKLLPTSTYRREVDTATSVLGTETGFDTYWLGFKYTTNHVLSVGSLQITRGPRVVIFSQIFENKGIIATPTMFRVIEDGYYFVDLNVGVRKQSNVRIRKNNQPIPELSINLVDKQEDWFYTKSKSSIIKLSSGDYLDVFLQNGSLYSDRNIQTSLNLFRLNGTDSSPLVTVERTTVFSVFFVYLPIHFDKVINNVGFAWDADNSQFVCKVPGIYMISFATGKSNSIQCSILIQKNSSTRGMLRNTITNDRYGSFVSRSVLYELSVDDKVSVSAQCITDPEITSTILNIFYVSA